MKSRMLRSSLNHGGEEHARLGIHGLAQLVVELGKLHRIGMNAIQIAQLQPLAGEVIDERGGFGIKQHAAHLRVQNIGDASGVFSGELQQLRDRACCSTRNRTGAKRVRNRRWDGRLPDRAWDRVQSIDELRRDQNRFYAEAHRLLKTQAVFSPSATNFMSLEISAGVAGRR